MIDPRRHLAAARTQSAFIMLLRFAILFLAVAVRASAAAEPPQPTQANVPYGTHERQVLDVYRVDTAGPAPVVFFIHGGGWNANSKENVHKLLDLDRLRRAGIAIVAINYRYAQQAQRAGVTPPVKAPLEDAARALQFVRSKAAEWNLDKERIGASGGSAGACSSLWLALHDDLAQPQSSDPIARESTRLACAAVVGAQTTLDPALVREWMPNATYGAHAFGLRTDGKDRAAEFQRLYEAREKLQPWIDEYSPLTHASAGDPPLWLTYSDKEPVKKGDEPKDPTHSALYGLILAEKLAPLGVEVTVTYPGAPVGPHRNVTDFFLARLPRSSR